MDKILVTGSSGFIGRHIVEKLPKSQVITDTDSYGRVNFQNKEQVMKMKPADIVIHMAGKTPQNNLGWEEYFENNVIGTLNVLQYCIKNKVKKIIYVSSYVYGDPKYCPIDESHPINPHNAYTESKYIGERLCEFYCKKSDLNVIILRPFNIFGDSMREGYLISNLIDAAKTGKKLTIVNKNSKRDFLHVNDFVDLILKIKDFNSKLEIFNVGAGVSYSFDKIIKKIEKISGKKIDINFKEDETFIEDIRADISKIENSIEWKPKTGIDDWLKKIEI